MRTQNQVGQIVCPCGRIGELRTRSNGKLLPFLMCKHCGMKQGKAALRDEWLANEKPNHSLGVYGEFLSKPDDSSGNLKSTSNETSKTVIPEQVVTSSEHQKDWQPDEDNLTDNIKAEQAASSSKTETSSSDTSNETSNSGLSLSAKLGLGFLTLVAAAIGISNLNVPK